MKKLISLALALVLIFTICVPVFAATLNAATPMGSTPVRVDGSTVGASYTVTIPAEFPINWDETDATEVPYKVNTEMNAISSIKVKVSSDGTGTLTNSVNNTDVLYNETANFDVETTFRGMVTDGKQDPAPTVTVSGWDDVPVGEYRTTLTYTVEYDDGTP